MSISVVTTILFMSCNGSRDKTRTRRKKETISIDTAFTE